MRQSLRSPQALAVLCSFLLLAPRPVVAVAQTSPPNLLILLSDDQGWGDLSVNGNSNLRTPNIDGLAKQGASFERFFVCPLCAPTRAELLTGRDHPRGGVSGVSTGKERLNTDEKTIAEAFKAAGYATGCFGKWHNGSQWPYHPNARGFNEFYGFTSGHWGEYFDPPLDHNGQPVRGKGYIADDLTDHALRFIETNQAGPFLCYVAFNTPHSPFAVPQEYWLRFKDKPLTLRARDGNPEKLDETRCVLAMCENLDWNAGRLLQKLESLKLADNTIVIYFSDNGPNTFRWNGGMKGRKGSTDEGGVRVPFFIRWPGRIKAGAIVPDIAGAIDLLPTLTAMARIPRVGDKPLDGKDLSPLLLGHANVWPERMIFSYESGQISVRTPRFRLASSGELFDMIADPEQRENIAPKQQDTAATLVTAISAWRKEIFGDTLAVVDGRKARARNPVGSDQRPYPVGYPVFPRTPLPARDGVPHGGIRRSAAAPNCSYFVNWTRLDDSMTWDIEVVTTGNYEVEIQYTCPEADANSTVELAYNADKLVGKVTPGWDPPLYTNQDTIPRHGESQMKEFHTLNLGVIHLSKSRATLTLRALAIPGKSVMDMRQVVLTLQK
jgi:arylsulfatase A-like enzyme